MPEKPTLNECLDALAIIWEHAGVATKADKVLDDFDAKFPGWKTAPMPLSHRDPGSHATMQRIKALSRVRDVLKRAGRIRS